MNNKKLNFIIIVLFLGIIIVFSYYFMQAKKNNKDDSNISNESDSYNGFDEIVAADNSSVCTVNGEVITNKDLKLTEILNEEKSDTSKEKTIQQKVILQKIKKDDIVLNDRESQYIHDIIEDLKNDAEINRRYTEDEKEEFIAVISEKLYNDALIGQHKAEFIKQLANRTFSTEDEKIMNLYNICLQLQEKWDNKENISYSDLLKSREDVYNAYIEKLVSESDIN